MWASDLSPPLVTKAPQLPPTWTWAGPYLGLNLGYSWGQWDSSGLIAGHPVNFDPKVDGWLGGAQGGYNWQFGRWLLGVEGDIEKSGEQDSINTFIPGVPSICKAHGCNCAPAIPAVDATSDWKFDWFSTLRGRAGFTYDRWLVYVTGGAAVGEAEFDTTVGSESKVKGGWTVGGGVEALIAPHWSAKLEYLYLDLGSETFLASTPNWSMTTKIQDQVLRLGVNYQFGGI